MADEEGRPTAETGLQEFARIEELITRSREGDLRAMEGIYQHFSRRIFNVVYRHTYNREAAEDLLQEIFVKVFTHIQKLRSADTFTGWLYRIAINACYSYLRENRIRLQQAIPLREVEGVLEGNVHPASDQMLKESLDEAIQTLPQRMKTIFLLHDVQGFKHEEIAPVLGCTVGTSKSQLFKARMKIRDCLERKKIF